MRWEKLIFATVIEPISRVLAVDRLHNVFLLAAQNSLAQQSVCLQWDRPADGWIKRHNVVNVHGQSKMKIHLKYWLHVVLYKHKRLRNI